MSVFPNIRGLSNVESNKEDYNHVWLCKACKYRGPRIRHLIRNDKKLNIPCFVFEYDGKWLGD